MELNAIISNYSDFLYYFKKAFPESIYHNSSIFHRDIQYVLTRYIQKKEKYTLPVVKSEEMAFQIESELEKKGVFKKVSDKSWVLNYPGFIKPKVIKTI
jgi:hypothetical protein